VPLNDGTIATCPIIARNRGNKRVLILTPAGDKLWTTPK